MGARKWLRNELTMRQESDTVLLMTNNNTTPAPTHTIDQQRNSYLDRYRRTHLVYVSNEESPDMPRPPFGSTRGDGSADDQAWKRYNREEIAIQRRHAAAALDLPPKALRFSRRAGCSCGCSPGFIVQPVTTTVADLAPNWTTYVTVTSPHPDTCHCYTCTRPAPEPTPEPTHEDDVLAWLTNA